MLDVNLYVKSIKIVISTRGRKGGVFVPFLRTERSGLGGVVDVTFPSWGTTDLQRLSSRATAITGRARRTVSSSPRVTDGGRFEQRGNSGHTSSRQDSSSPHSSCSLITACFFTLHLHTVPSITLLLFSPETPHFLTPFFFMVSYGLC